MLISLFLSKGQAYNDHTFQQTFPAPDQVNIKGSNKTFKSFYMSRIVYGTKYYFLTTFIELAMRFDMLVVRILGD